MPRATILLLFATGPAAIISPDNIGPITATTLSLEITLFIALIASFLSPLVSSTNKLILTAFASALISLTANSAPALMDSPYAAAPPVVVVNNAILASLLFALPASLLLPQPAATAITPARPKMAAFFNMDLFMLHPSLKT